jgi:hypothetical protein
MARGTGADFIKPRAVIVAYTQKQYFVLLGGVTQVDDIVRLKHAHRDEAEHFADSLCVQQVVPQRIKELWKRCTCKILVSSSLHNFRIIVTAADVLPSITVPRLGVKADATPGRLNQVRFSINRPGLLYGQCSEICGANHGFIPTVVERVSTNQFIN